MIVRDPYGDELFSMTLPHKVVGPLGEALKLLVKFNG